jgi:UDP-N-acetylglucosamine 2-epimerase (non-hydrolysing)
MVGLGLVKKFLMVAGARPNFMKIAPIARAALVDSRIDIKIVHTGQHYDYGMSDVFFSELNIPAPNYHLNVGAGTQTEQMAKIMMAFETVCIQEKPDGVIVVGDVTSTIAAALVAKRLGLFACHVEAGLRSGDKTMPEEVNRILTDAVCDHLFATEQAGVDNLLLEGRASKDIFLVGHVMVDTLMYQITKMNQIDQTSWLSPAIKSTVNDYAVVTLHRASNVDDSLTLQGFVEALNVISQQIPIIFPVHPRTRANLKKLGISLSPRVQVLDPLSYMDFLNLWKDACFVITDSGGLQEETTALGVPCLTARLCTERPITVEQGSNTIVGVNPENIINAAMASLAGHGKKGKCPQLWDGYAAQRIVATLAA